MVESYGREIFSARQPMAAAMSAKPSPNTPVPTESTVSPGLRTLFIAPHSATMPSPVGRTTSCAVPAKRRSMPQTSLYNSRYSVPKRGGP